MREVKIGDASVSAYSNGVAAHGPAISFSSAMSRRCVPPSPPRRASCPGSRDPTRTRLATSCPTSVCAEIYLSRAGVQRYLPLAATGASQLDTFVDYGATSGMAAGARVREDGVQVNLVSDLDPTLEQRSPTVFASLPQFEPDLADEAGPRALGYIGVGELGPAINKALETAGAGAQGLAGSLRALAQSLQKQAGVDPLKDLLPALGGQAALIAEPTNAAPYASLIVDGVDEEKAGDALASLQQPLLRALGTPSGQVPSFQNREVDGVSVHSLQVSPTSTSPTRSSTASWSSRPSRRGSPRSARAATTWPARAPSRTRPTASRTGSRR